jgi:hypothetical protein
MQPADEATKKGLAVMDILVIAIEQVAEGYVIRFSRPVPVYLLAVATAEGVIVWKITPLGFKRNDVVGSAFLSAEVSVLPGVVHNWESLRHAPAAAVPDVESVIYGSVPEGYKEITPARPLKRGTKYHVISMGARGDATAVFTTSE